MGLPLIQTGFTYSACRWFIKNIKKQEIQDIAYGDFKDLFRRRASDKVLYDKAFNIAKNLKHDAKFLGGAVTCAGESATKSEIMWSQQLAQRITQANYKNTGKTKSVLIF